MTAPRSIDRVTFLTYVRQSGLLAEEQVGQLARQYPELTSGRGLARALVGDGTLTRFQAERLLQGRTAGFFLDQYRILEQIGRGGMGRVFKAEHRTMKRLVALKVLASELLQTDRAVELFLHEVRAVGRLVHPNIVTAFDANQAHGRYYLVLEFVDGPNLDQLVRRQGPLSFGLACDYVKQAATGLQCAHLLGMVHRDIKPANVLVQSHGLGDDDSPGLVKVGDFGLARLAHPDSPQKKHQGTIVTKENMVMGTPDYLSPEQARSLHRTDIRTDIYSLGCTFYYLLTGSVPFPGGGQLDKLIRHATERPRPVGEFRSDVPAGVLAVVERMMAKHPDQRYATPAEVAEALQPFAASGPIAWARGSQQDLLAIDALPTPPEGLVSASDGDLTAMANTVSGDQSPTAGIVTTRRPPRRSSTSKDHLHVALLIGVIVVGGLFLLLLVLALLSR